MGSLSKNMMFWGCNLMVQGCCCCFFFFFGKMVQSQDQSVKEAFTLVRKVSRFCLEVLILSPHLNPIFTFQCQVAG